MGVYEIFVHGAERRKHVVSVEVSTPKAKAYIDALLSSALFDVSECTLSLRELRAIAGNEPLAEVTQPMIEPAPDVIEDLWQMTHVTASYIGRAAGGAILLADGVLHNSAISIVIAALFLPFLSPVLAVGFGAWSGDTVLSATVRLPFSPAQCWHMPLALWWLCSPEGRSDFRIAKALSPASRFRPRSAWRQGSRRRMTQAGDI